MFASSLWWSFFPFDFGFRPGPVRGLLLARSISPAPSFCLPHWVLRFPPSWPPGLRISVSICRFSRCKIWFPRASVSAGSNSFCALISLSRAESYAPGFSPRVKVLFLVLFVRSLLEILVRRGRVAPLVFLRRFLAEIAPVLVLPLSILEPGPRLPHEFLSSHECSILISVSLPAHRFRFPLEIFGAPVHGS
jgi:hypothetical protein